MSSDLVAVTAPAQLGEGPLWDGVRHRLMWVDILAETVHEFDPATGKNLTVQFDLPVAALALREDGRYLLAAGLAVASCAWPGTEVDWIADVDRGIRLNDGAVDPSGRYLVGTMVEAEHAGSAALYLLERDEIREVLGDVTISNGLDWSPDGGTLYYVDTPLERIDAFDYDVATGAMTNRRVFTDLRDIPGRPDGLTVDADGGVWVAMARGGAAVRRFTPDGRLDQVLELPVPNATSVAFGGDELADLYITTSQLRMSDDDLARYPDAGCLFRATNVGVHGRLPHLYS